MHILILAILFFLTLFNIKLWHLIHVYKNIFVRYEYEQQNLMAFFIDEKKRTWHYINGKNLIRFPINHSCINSDVSKR